MDKVIITGGSGLIGNALSTFLVSRGFEVVILSRTPNLYKKLSAGISYASWNINDQSVNEDAFASAKYIVHLAGAGVADKPWTEKRKKEIVESRTLSSALLVKALKNISNEIISVVSASATGWYKANLPVAAI